MLDLLWKLGFYEIWNDKIFWICELDFDKNECENECIIIRKWLDSEKTVDLWEFEHFYWLFGGGMVILLEVEIGILVVKWGDYRKVFRKIFGDFLWIFYSVMGKWNKMCVEIALARFQNKNILKKCKISPIKKTLKKCHIL